MARRVEDLSAAGVLDRAAAVHDDDPVAVLGDGAEVVGEDHECGVVGSTHLHEEFHDRGLHGSIERCGWFVGDQQAWLAGHRDRDRDSLGHPT